MHNQLSHLLPYQHDFLLKSLDDRIRILKTILFIFNESISAIKHYLAGNLKEFDAQVSENLCQVRAIILSRLYNNLNKKQHPCFISFLEQIKSKQHSCALVLDQHNAWVGKRPSHYTKHINKPISTNEFINAYDLNLPLSFQSYFLIQCHILSKYKLESDFEISHGIDYVNLCQSLQLSSKTYTKRLVHCLQRNLSQLTLPLLTDISDDNNQKILLNSLHLSDEIGRNAVACYEATKVILNDIKTSHIPVKIIVHHFADKLENPFSFMLTTSSSAEHFQQDFTATQSETMLTFVGICDSNNAISSKEEYIRAFNEVGLDNVILANMAQHPQYSGIALEAHKINPYRSLQLSKSSVSPNIDISHYEKKFLNHKHLAATAGCSQQNRTLFLLTHVYCRSTNEVPSSSYSEIHDEVVHA